MSKKSPVDSDNYYLYPEWFEGGNASNQSQPSTSSYSYPTLEYIWSNAVRLTRATHSNLQDEIEYIEANLGGGGNLSCNCSELEYKIDINSTKIYYNSVNITPNANKIANLSDIKLSRDGSQPMTGLLQCEAGLKTNTISTISGETLTCDKDLVVNSHIWGDPLLTIGSGADFPDAYPHIEFSYNSLVLITPGESGPLERIYIYGGWDDGEIMIKNADLAPFTDNRRDLGFPGYTWRCVYAAKGNFSGTIVPDAILTNSANISDLDARVDYLEENLSTCNCSALQFGIDSNTTKIANLSTIKLSRDGSQTMTGSLKCEAGLKTNDIANLSDTELSIIGGTPNSEEAQIKLTDSKISLLTANSNGILTERFRIPSGSDTVVVLLKDADFAPFHDNVRNLGYAFLRWKEICGYVGNFSSIEVKSHIWSNNTFRIGHGASATEDTKIRFTSNDLTLMTPNSNGTSTERVSLTGNADRSIVYIKNAHLLPYDNLSSYLGSSAHRWVEVFANRGSFTHINAINESTLDIEDDVKIAQKLWGKDNLVLAGGDPSSGHSQIEICNNSYIGYQDTIRIYTTNTSKELEERVRIWGDTDYCFIYFGGDVVPLDDDVYSLGGPSLRWSDIYAVNTHWGDLGFVENVCPKCNKKFKIGDNIVLKVVRFSEEDGGIMTIPIHLECAQLPTKTIRKKYPVKERYYEWDERQGKVIAKWRTKKQKKKIKKKRLKSGYKINQKTGKIESTNRKNIDLSEAVEEVVEEIEEIVYQEKEIKI